MPRFIECQALVNDQPARYKKTLKEAVAQEPQSVWFQSVGGLFDHFSGGLEDIPRGTVLTIVGPDPWRDRRWYATVADGRVS